MHIRCMIEGWEHHLFFFFPALCTLVMLVSHGVCEINRHWDHLVEDGVFQIYDCESASTSDHFARVICSRLIVTF